MWCVAGFADPGQRAANSAGKRDAMCTDLQPGPSAALEIAQRRIHSVMFWVPTLGDLAAGFSILRHARARASARTHKEDFPRRRSYANRVGLGVALDECTGIEPGEVCRFFVEVRARCAQRASARGWLTVARSLREGA
jgi:hypothetical protein